MNYTKTFLLITCLTCLCIFVGQMIAGPVGAWIALMISMTMNITAYWKSSDMVLRMHNAIELDKSMYANVYESVERMIKVAEIPMPKLYLIDSHVPNAFATGRNPHYSAVAFSKGIYDLLSHEELSGVIAHELAHIKHRDILISTITATFAGALSMLGSFWFFMPMLSSDEEGSNPLASLVLMLLAPLVATIIQFGVSRTREYAADEGGAKICGNPLWLASALQKIEQSQKNQKFSKSKLNKSAQHMYILNPFKAGNHDSLFSTHPATNNRINKLYDIAHSQGINVEPIKNDSPKYYNQENVSHSTMVDNSSNNEHISNSHKDSTNSRYNPWDDD